MKSAKSPEATDRILKENGFLLHFSFDIRPYLRVTEYEKGEYIIRNTDQLTRISSCQCGVSSPLMRTTRSVVR